METRTTEPKRAAPSRRRDAAAALPDNEFRHLAEFRVWLREFQSFSERSSLDVGITSLQYQALLAIKAHGPAGPVTVTALAEALIIKHNSAVGLIDRIEQLGLVVRKVTAQDRRSVAVELTPRGIRAVNRLARLHRQELRRVAGQLGRHADRFARSIEPSR